MINPNRIRSLFALLLSVGFMSSVTTASAADIGVAFTGILDDISRAYFTTSGDFTGGTRVQGMRFASSFTMSGTSVSLASIEVPLLTQGINDDVQVTFSVYSDNAGAPGAVYATQNNAAFKPNTEFAYYTGTFSNPTLVAATKYWLVVELNATTQTDAPTLVGVTDVAYSSLTQTAGTPAFDAVVNEGSGWNSTVDDTTYVGVLVNPPTVSPYSLVYNLNVVPVPEPSTYVLCGLAVSALGMVAQRRKMKLENS
ncbi:PEP-CTERM sorting domain-containing protein [bacterium]|nr:PEP-CTERM sorting domain-containing protein [bacterium]